MNVYVTCNNEEDAIKMKAVEWPQHFSHYKSMVIFSNTQGQAKSAIGEKISAKFELVRDFMHVLVTCKNKNDPTKNN